MRISKKTVIDRLKEFHNGIFTGAIKIGIQDGVFNQICLSNDCDLPKTETKDDLKTLDNVFEMVTPRFNGTLIFYYKKGVVTHYAYNQTYKAESLTEFLYGDKDVTECYNGMTDRG